MSCGEILSPTKIGIFSVNSVGLHLADFVKFDIEGQSILGQVAGMERFPNKTIANINVLGYSSDGKVRMPTIPPKPGDNIYHADDTLIRSVLHSPENGIYIGLLRGHKIPIRLSPEILLNKHLALLAMTGGGKSYAAGVIMEELMLRKYPIVVIDVSNEYGSKMIYPNHQMRHWRKFHRYPRGFPDNIIRITKWDDDKGYKLIKPGQMLVLNIKRVREGEQPAIVRDVCDSLFDWRNSGKIKKCFLIIEETHKFAPQRKNVISSDGVARMLSEGRKIQLGCCIISQRPAKVSKDALSQCWTQILHKITNRNDLKYLEECAERAPPNFIELLQTLGQGEALVIGGGLNFNAVVEIRERMSGHR